MSEEKAIFDEYGNATQTGMATCYSYDAKTGGYLGSFEFYTLIGSGIPASSTLTESPSATDGQAAIFQDGKWYAVEDHRGETVYSTTDGSEKKVTAIGAYPDKTTNLGPSSKYDA